jgi:hypothetical protein
MSARVLPVAAAADFVAARQEAAAAADMAVAIAAVAEAVVTTVAHATATGIKILVIAINKKAPVGAFLFIDGRAFDPCRNINGQKTYLLLPKRWHGS